MTECFKKVFLGVCWLGLITCELRAELDESPLPVEVAPAFPELQWPDWITGIDTGKPIKPRPLIITGSGDGSNRLFVATQYGTIHSFENDPNTSEMQLFLDIRDRVVPFKEWEGEEGFLGLAFHPRFKENGEFFVYYTPTPSKDNPHSSRISRFRTKKDNPEEADPDSEEILLEIKEPYWNHNGGTVAFGPDGFLYIVVGDGGAWNDPHMNGQNTHTLLGALLRIDVDHKDEGLAYAIPKDNPFYGQPAPPKDGPFAGANCFPRGEIWAYGLRNPWRVTFDRKTGACWAADVGQDTWEEIDIIQRGGNYGWNLREGQHPFGPAGFPECETLIEPIWEYHHDVGKSITGGHVYRGRKVPELEGAYLYADYVSGKVWALWYDFQNEVVTANRLIQEKGFPVMTFGEDDQGEVYFTTEQDIYKFAPAEK
ncbi:PQQ-dependent sugar dehydrogenase [Bythopirellula goksoeyrii]|uniref:Quinoprotein glucose dehydrogenase B n=1 Tax=Bythopirellula goksoeyrii TaxID=1400387 RepID=A0A5B9Q246_9BACT|nr:PQQ-dependent sugar dehydrogenase [Bythopirellula goksoeyrii]QEG33107.1 Quinoprotein glucose dehydrogenase B precursor [Bythopirellula goksoeyrii]